MNENKKNNNDGETYRVTHENGNYEKQTKRNSLLKAGQEQYKNNKVRTHGGKERKTNKQTNKKKKKLNT